MTELLLLNFLLKKHLTEVKIKIIVLYKKCYTLAKLIYVIYTIQILNHIKQTTALYECLLYEISI
jgi:hypothetical protein